MATVDVVEAPIVVEFTETRVEVLVGSTTTGGGPVGLGAISYLVQTVASKYWVDTDFVRGQNIIGVRNLDADVFLPHDLSTEKIVTVKDEMGGNVTVFAY